MTPSLTKAVFESIVVNLADPRDLANLCLVSRLLSQIAQPHLAQSRARFDILTAKQSQAQYQAQWDQAFQKATQTMMEGIKKRRFEADLEEEVERNGLNEEERETLAKKMRTDRKREEKRLAECRK